MGIESLLAIGAGVGGSVAGGAAGSALAQLFAPAPIGPDTSVPGVSKAVLQPATKDNPELAVAQTDPTQAINYFKKSAKDYQGYAMTGLGLYGAAIGQAISSVNNTTASANQALADNLGGVAKAGSKATDAYLQMMGVPDSAGNTLTNGQIQAKLEATPGYQFALSQGSQAAARTGAAAGMLGSGNTLAAATTFGQGLANQTYQGYLTNLQPIIQSGDVASSQIGTGQSSNYMNQGNSLAQLYGNIGSASLNTYQTIGQAYYNADQTAGTGTLNTALANTKAQNDALAQQRGLNQQAQQSNQSAGLQQQQLNLMGSQFAWQQQQGAQYAAQFSSNGGSSGSTYTAGGLTFPNYTGAV